MSIFDNLGLSDIEQTHRAGMSTPKPKEKSPGAKKAGKFYLELKKLDCIRGIGFGQLEIIGTGYNLFIRSTYNDIHLFFVNADYIREVKKAEGSAGAETAFETPKEFGFDKFKAVPYFLDTLSEMPEELQSYIVTHIPEFGDCDVSDTVRDGYRLHELFRTV